MTIPKTISLYQLDSLVHALDDYLAITLDEHYEHNRLMTSEFKSARQRLLSAYHPVEAKVWAIKAFDEVPVTIE
jgi:L-lysine 2,3-aminomutase